jgi:hypothetical protein
MRSRFLFPAAYVLSGAILGFAGATLSSGGVAPQTGADSTARSSFPLRSAAGLEHDRGPSGADTNTDTRAAGGGIATTGGAGAASATKAGASEQAARTELGRLRAREREAQEGLSTARKRIAELERKLGSDRPRHDFDFTKEDWKQMAASGEVMKYRIPCGGARPPGDDVLDELGLAPDDRAVLQRAYDDSAKRMRNALLPLCAAALGNRMDLAGAMSVDSCRHIIISTSRTRNEDPSQGAQRVADFMAGDGPRPGPSAGLTERAFLTLAEESGLFEEDLAQAFGPEEAHRLVFSDRLCFSSGTHQLTGGRAAGAQ